MTDKPKPQTHSAHDYGRNAEPLPELYVYSHLSALDAEYADVLAVKRARQETLEREIMELAKRLVAPLHGIEPEPQSQRDLRATSKRG